MTTEEVKSELEKMIKIADMPSDEFIGYMNENYPDITADNIRRIYPAKLGHVSGLLAILLNKIEVFGING